MGSVCLYLKVHQPYQLKHFSSEDVAKVQRYEDAAADKETINRISDSCYIPANKLMLELINKHNGLFKITYSISGTVLGLLSKYRPDVIESFASLVNTSCVEIMAETYYHSLSWLNDKKEFERQISKHEKLVYSLFKIKPAVFRNTELIYCNKLAAFVAGMGYKGILCEGLERILKGRNVNKVYSAPGVEGVGLLLRNVALSDDIAFRFDDKSWSEHPLTAEKFADWIHKHPQETEAINLFVDYETFGMHKKAASGIFEFLGNLPGAILKNEKSSFALPSEILSSRKAEDIYDVPKTISWEDKERECCVWCENMMQNNTLKKIYSLERLVVNSKDERIFDIWGRLQAADYFYYMAEKNEGNKYVSPFATAKEVFDYYNNIVTDFEISLIKKELNKNKPGFRLTRALLF